MPRVYRKKKTSPVVTHTGLPHSIIFAASMTCTSLYHVHTRREATFFEIGAWSAIIAMFIPCKARSSSVSSRSCEMRFRRGEYRASATQAGKASWNDSTEHMNSMMRKQ